MIVTPTATRPDPSPYRHSAGPRDLDGMPAPRARSLGLTLASQVVVPEDKAAIHGRGKEWLFSLRPQNRFQGWVVEAISVVSLRVDRQERIERRLRDRACLRAEVCWDADRRHEVEVLGAGLADRPEEVLSLLKKGPHGCDWLIRRWAMLARVADRDGSWTPDQTALAHRMLGTPAEFRSGDPSEIIDVDGRVVGSPSDLATLARRESASLQALRVERARLDDIDRALAESDHPVQESAELRQARRHASSLNHHLRWLLKQVGVVPDLLRTAPHLEGYFDAEAVKPIAVVPAPPIPAGSREARLRKREARRRVDEARLRRRQG